MICDDLLCAGYGEEIDPNDPSHQAGDNAFWLSERLFDNRLYRYIWEWDAKDCEAWVKRPISLKFIKKLKQAKKVRNEPI